MVKKVSKRVQKELTRKKVLRTSPVVVRKTKKGVKAVKNPAYRVVMGDRGKNMKEVGMRIHRDLAKQFEQLADSRGTVNIPQSFVEGYLQANGISSGVEEHRVEIGRYGEPVTIHMKGLSLDGGFVQDCGIDPKFDLRFTGGAAAAPQKSVMDEATEVIYGDREKTYGHPSLNLQTIAQMWTVYVKRKAEVEMAKFEHHFGGFAGMPPVKDIVPVLTIDDVCQMMVLLKMARLLNDPKHRDGLVDQVGYIGLQDRCNNV